MDVERSSLCNCVVNFLLQENYLLTVFELLRELLEDGRHNQTIRLRDFFGDPSLFPPDQISRFNSLRDVLSKIFHLTSVPTHGNDITHRHEKANVFCESIHALHATDLPSTSIYDFLLPAIQNLLKDVDSLDPSHKEALEIILKERSGGAFESISNKVMGTNLGIASTVSNFFGETGFLGKKEISSDLHETPASRQPNPPPVQQDTRFQRMMRSGFSEILRGKSKGREAHQVRSFLPV